MRTYKVTFSEKNTGNRFNYKTTNEDFKRMRTFVLRAENYLDKCFMHRLVDVCDDIKDMEVGTTLFVISSAWEVYTANNIHKFNDVVGMMDRASVELGEQYQPNEFSAFMVKRTAKMWQFATLSSELN
jgi:hypothetical protein